MVVSQSETSGILYATQTTHSKGVRLTEIFGGGTALPTYYFTEKNKEKYKFHMEGGEVLSLTGRLIREMFDNVEKDSGFKLSDIDMIIPHQASSALGLIMRKLGIADGKYIDITKNMGIWYLLPSICTLLCC